MSETSDAGPYEVDGCPGGCAGSEHMEGCQYASGPPKQLTAGDMRAEWQAGYQRGLADALRDGLPDRNRLAVECAEAYSQRDDALQELAEVRERLRVREEDVEELRADLDALREQDAPAQVRAVLQWVADTGCTCPGDVAYADINSHQKGCPALLEHLLLRSEHGAEDADA